VAKKKPKKSPKKQEWFTSLLAGEWYRGADANGRGVGVAFMGKGLYLTWERPVAEAFAELAAQKSGAYPIKIETYRLKPGLKLLDNRSAVMADIKKSLGAQPWEKIENRVFATLLAKTVQDAGYDGVIESNPADGLVIFNADNAVKITPSDKYRRNIDLSSESFRRDIRDRELEAAFLQLHYAGKVHFEILRLLAILDLVPAAEIIREQVGEDNFRKTIQLEVLDIEALEAAYPGLIKMLALTSSNMAWQLIPGVTPLPINIALVLISCMRVISNIGKYIYSFDSLAAWPTSPEYITETCQELSRELFLVLGATRKWLRDAQTPVITVIYNVLSIGGLISALLDAYCSNFADSERTPAVFKTAAEFDLLEGNLIAAKELNFFPVLRRHVITNILEWLGNPV